MAAHLAFEIDDRLRARGFPRKQSRRDELLRLFQECSGEAQSFGTHEDALGIWEKVKRQPDSKLTAAVIQAVESEFDKAVELMLEKPYEKNDADELSISSSPPIPYQEVAPGSGKGGRDLSVLRGDMQRAKGGGKRNRGKRWDAWQIGQNQLSLPDTQPGSDHTGITLGCWKCERMIISGKEIHQIKPGVIWSNCVPNTVEADDSPMRNIFKRCDLFKVYCGQCRENIGALYLEPYFDTDTNSLVEGKVFPCVKFRHVSQQKDGKLQNHLVLLGKKEDVENAVRELSTTSDYNKYVDPGSVRPATNRRTHKDFTGMKKALAESESKMHMLREERAAEAEKREQLEREREVLMASKEAAREQELAASREREKLTNKQRELELEQQKTEMERAQLEAKHDTQRKEIDEKREQLEKEKEELMASKKTAREQELAARREREELTNERKNRQQAERLHEKKMQEYIQQVEREREEEQRRMKHQIKLEMDTIEDQRRELLEKLEEFERERQKLEKRAAQDPAEVAKLRVQRLSSCPAYKAADTALRSMGLDEKLFARQWDRCYCPTCYPANFKDCIKNDGPKPYVVPRGWVRFGLQVPAQAHVQDVFQRWCVSFHGTKRDVAKAIVEVGDLLMPGDTLPDGTQLGSSNCAGRTDKMIYTSPTINYAGLGFYARPCSSPDGRIFQVVLQCRQRPGSFKLQSETMRFGMSRELCPHVSTAEVEWITTARKSLIPYGILIKTFQAQEPPKQYFRSPVDPRPLYEGDPGERGF